MIHDAPAHKQPQKYPEKPPETWPLRAWQHQAARLYRRPEARRLALLHHLEIRRRHAVTVEQVLWLDAIGRDLDGEVTP